jgi:feruloyl esterase
MPALSRTLANLARYRKGMDAMASASSALMKTTFTPNGGAPTLPDITDFGANPGALRMLAHIPPNLPPNAPLVVVLHGCGQTAAGYAYGAGWLDLADRHGFALLLPEQRRDNNAGGCFNWFTPGDTARGQGEAASIRAMIQHALTTWKLNRAQIFVTGLSAGGAFANVLLATYPDLFAAGAIIAGLPYGGATDTQSALDMMFNGQQRTDQAWGDLIRAASPHTGPWPRIAIWHGLTDSTVIPANGTDAVRQWLNVQALADTAPTTTTIGPATQQTWRNAKGRIAVQSVTIPQFGHGTPINQAECGHPAPFILNSALSSTTLIAESWGLTKTTAQRRPTPAPAKPSLSAIIDKALRAAGLSGPG